MQHDPQGAHHPAGDDRYVHAGDGTTTLYGRNGWVISRATGNTVIMHDGVSGQVFGDRPKWGKRR